MRYADALWLCLLAVMHMQRGFKPDSLFSQYQTIIQLKKHGILHGNSLS